MNLTLFETLTVTACGIIIALITTTVLPRPKPGPGEEPAPAQTVIVESEDIRPDAQRALPLTKGQVEQKQVDALADEAKKLDDELKQIKQAIEAEQKGGKR